MHNTEQMRSDCHDIFHRCTRKVIPMKYERTEMGKWEAAYLPCSLDAASQLWTHILLFFSPALMLKTLTEPWRLPKSPELCDLPVTTTILLLVLVVIQSSFFVLLPRFWKKREMKN
jgi:hypothetical protein